MELTGDKELLASYAADGSETAFREIVDRHLNLVWGTAWRITSDADLARDIAQTVFCALARKAGELHKHENLAGWLHTSATFESRKVLRTNIRRQQREIAAMENLTGQNSHDDRLLPLLDEALTSLPEKEREILLLRFFSKQSFAQISAALSLSEDAAQKRASRAIEKLKSWFASRGVATSSAVVTGLLGAASAQAAPVALGSSIVTAAALGGGTTATFSILSIMNTKLALAATVVAVALPLVFQQRTIAREREKNEALNHAIVSQFKEAKPVFKNGNELAELEQLRAEVAAYYAKPTTELSPQVIATRDELERVRKQRIELEEELAEAKVRTETINALKIIGVAARLFENDKSRFPAKFDEMQSEIGGKLPGNLSLDTFEVIQHERPISEREPAMHFAKEKTPRKRKDGIYERAYVFADGSVQTFTSPTPDFSHIDEQGFGKQR